MGVGQDDEGVTITAQPKDSSDAAERTTWRAAYAVGADGAHSSVRRLLGEPFPGRSVLSSVVLADVKLADGPTDGGLTLGSTRREFGFLVPYGRRDPDGAWYRAMTWDRAHQVGDDVPVQTDEVVEVLNRAMRRDVGVVEVGWHSRSHCDERQVAHYRRGRVFLAGDAALAPERLTLLQRTSGFVLAREQGTPAPAGPDGLRHAQRRDGGPALLIRPDGFVAWAGHSTDGGWRPALARWTGRREER